MLKLHLILQAMNQTSRFSGNVGSEGKKAKRTKKCVIKRKTKFENYKNCLEATQLESKINHIEKNKIDVDRIKENLKEFIRINKSILKTQQRFKSERHNVFTEDINKMSLSSNDDKRMQSIDSIETCKWNEYRSYTQERKN